MGYAARYLNAVGQDCTVARNPDECSKVSMKRSTSAIRDFGARESHWEGLILSSAGLISGDNLTVDGTISQHPCSGSRLIGAPVPTYVGSKTGKR